MNWLTNLLATSLSPQIAAGAGPQPISLTFKPPLTPELRAQLVAEPLTLTVSQVKGNEITFTLPSGTNLVATTNIPLPPGTQLQLSAAEILPNQPQPTTLPLQAKILSTPETSQPLPPTSSPQIPGTTLTTPPITNQSLRTLITTTLLQITAPQPTTSNSQTLTSSQPASLPPGPLPATFSTPIPPTLIGQPLILTPTQPLQRNATQPALLTNPATPAFAQRAAPSIQPIPITLTLGVALPTNQPQQATLVLPSNPQTLTSSQPVPQPILILTTPTPTQPQTPPNTFQLETPSTPQPTTPNIPTSSNPNTLISARVLAPTPSTENRAPSTEQTILLATGTTAVLKLPANTQPLPTGSVIVAEFPITPTTTVQRVLTPDAQSQPQPNTTTQQTQTAAPVAPQTANAILAPGMVLQGAITGQNEQGQPLLTITTPGPLQGQTAALNLSEPTGLLPVGATISIKVEANLNATITTLTLPPAAQAAYTLGTIGARWDGLQQALTVLQQQAPIQAANLRASLPQLQNLMPGLIAFTNALRTNKTDDAFDKEATRLLKSMGIDLSSDITQLSQLQQRHPAGQEQQWRGTLFPYVEAPGEDPRQGGFFWRREKSDNPRAPTNTRFVVEVDMSQIGPLQLDGLITYPDVWLKLRRTTPAEAGFTDGLQQLVNNLLESYGLRGGIAVETTTTFPVNPRTELLGETENPLPTSV